MSCFINCGSSLSNISFCMYGWGWDGALGEIMFFSGGDLSAAGLLPQEVTARVVAFPG